MMSLHTGRISGAEALLRWNHPEHGALAPTHFIQLAEETGLIDALGEWVLREACGEFGALAAQGVALPGISVNVSVRQFKQPRFVETLHKVLRETGMRSSALEIEITESLLLDATPAIEGMLGELSATGVRIALDDFGTGYSSLAYLKRFPVDAVKIDRSFIKDLPVDRSSAAITGAIISMAHALQKRVVAEGVVSAEQTAFLRGLGCDELQGYHLAKPMGAAELAVFLRRMDGRGADDVAHEGRTKPPVKASARG
jgi:EAL domain-containing protein (putative c-di-GMP-specific phosphodiesterase class I)